MGYVSPPRVSSPSRAPLWSRGTTSSRAYVRVRLSSSRAFRQVSSLATKLSDTLASEIGKAYGKTCYLSTTLKRVPPGTEGAVSLEGTLAGVAGSLVVAGYAAAVGLVPTWPALPVAAAAAFVATTCESWLGASVQGGFFTNEVINFINTLIGAVVGVALAKPLL